ncbi:hypothetical protein B9479_002323 [Cryptococcus floricola]|uniref:Uncharacterized protein n=1 Tax=Cryptococcus floricola TaxID=2591691 RepID=A0A5D3B1A5_9TREE|nr:hypothetical protein B9479_002323 [Cryptococcus floricola]
MNPEQEENQYEGSVSPMNTTDGRPSSGYQQPATQRPLTMSSGTLPANFASFSREQLLSHLGIIRPRLDSYMTPQSGDENDTFFDRRHPLYPQLAPVRDPSEVGQQGGRTTGGEGGSRSQNATFEDDVNTRPARFRGTTRAELERDCAALTREVNSLLNKLDEATEMFLKVSHQGMEMLQQSEAREQALKEELEQLKRERDADIILSQRPQHDPAQGED